MQIGGQDARIRRESRKGKFTVIHMGCSYPPSKVKLERLNIEPLLPKLPKENYVDVVITGETREGTLFLTGIRLKK